MVGLQIGPGFATPAEGFTHAKVWALFSSCTLDRICKADESLQGGPWPMRGTRGSVEFIFCLISLH